MLQIWVRDTLAALPPRHLEFVGPFAEWCVLRQARRAESRGRLSAGAASRDRTEVRAAIALLTWLDENQLALTGLAQPDLELWLTTAQPSMSGRIHAFVRWTNARRLTKNLEVPHRRTSLPSNFLEDRVLHDQLRRCLNDSDLPLEVRIAGALIRLYALPVVRIVALTADRFRQDETGAYLTISEHPVLLPPKLAHLIEEQIARPRATSMVGQRPDAPVRFIFPGRPASRPRSATALSRLLAQHDLPTSAAHNSAMIQMVKDLPPIVVSDLLGLHPATTEAWAGYAQDSWADYIAALPPTE